MLFVVRSGSRGAPLKLSASLRSLNVGTSTVTSVPGHPLTLARPCRGGPTADAFSPSSLGRPISSAASTSRSKPRSAATSAGVHDFSVSLHTSLNRASSAGPDCDTISTRADTGETTVASSESSIVLAKT